MAWHVMIEEDGTITLPPDLIDTMGWTSATPLRWVEREGGIALEPADADEDAGQS